MKTKLKGSSELLAISTAQDGIGLVQLIYTIMHKRDETTPSILDIVQADKRMYLTFQQKDQPTADYLWEFQAVVDIVKSLPRRRSGWSKPVAWAIANEEKINLSVATDDKKTKLMEHGQTRYLVALFFAGLNNARYSQLKQDIHNKWLVTGKDDVPRMYDQVMCLADGFRVNWPGFRGGTEEALAFSQASAPVTTQKKKKKDGVKDVGNNSNKNGNDTGSTAACHVVEQISKQTKSKKDKTCFHCGKPGHFIEHCLDFTNGKRAMIHAATSNNDDDSGADDDNDDESTKEVDICGFLPSILMLHGAVMGQSHNDNGQIISQNHKTKSAPCHTLNPGKLFLDICLTYYQSIIEDELIHIEVMKYGLRGQCNAGTSYSNHKGWLKDLFHIWVMPHGMANLLSIPQLECDGFKVQYHTGGQWVVTCPDNTDIIFKHDTGVTDGFPYV